MTKGSSNRPEQLLLEYLKQIGFSGDEELSKTHTRVTEFLASYAPKRTSPALSLVPTHSSDPIIVRELKYYSLCAHHLLPFFGEATIAILPNGAIAGLGGIPKAVRHFAEQPQIQERLSSQIAEFLLEQLNANAVVVKLSATQLCMEMRGSRASGEILTIASRGSQQGISRLETLLSKGVSQE
tara:strand:- start:11 stop:559 length:549 start_codon:yes stop_codon:yes gene_type:complete